MTYIFVLLFTFVLLPSLSFAEITKIVIEKRESFVGGHEFGVTGAYEKLVGKAYGEVDPNKKYNKAIVNLNKAPEKRTRAGGILDGYLHPQTCGHEAG
jgi:hydrogenase maturation factor